MRLPEEHDRTVSGANAFDPTLIGNVGIAGAVEAVICDTPWSFRMSVPAGLLLLPSGLPA
jgi:hypothetical protein